MNDFVMQPVVAQYAPQAADKDFAVFVTFDLIWCSLGNEAKRYVKVRASSTSASASVKRG